MVTNQERHAVPVAAIVVLGAMFLSLLEADATEPNALINFACVRAVSLTVGLITLCVGLLRSRWHSDPTAASLADRRPLRCLCQNRGEI